MATQLKVEQPGKTPAEVYEDAVHRTIAESLAAGREYATLCAQEMEQELERHLLRSRLISELLGTDNNGRPHSATSAKDAAEQDPRYVAHCKRQSETVKAKNDAYAASRAGDRRCELALALLRHATVQRELESRTKEGEVLELKGRVAAILQELRAQVTA